MTDEKILIDDFIKLDLRVGRVLDAKEVEDSRKMLTTIAIMMPIKPIKRNEPQPDRSFLVV